MGEHARRGGLREGRARGYAAAVSWPVLIASAALAGSWIVATRRLRPGAPWLEVLVIAAANLLLWGGLIGCGLALVHAFAPLPLAGGLVVGAAAAQPWRRPARELAPSPAPAPTPRRVWWCGAALLLIATALRLPLNDYQLAGRDQGTYQLRAMHIARTGGFDAVDPILAEAGEAYRERPGPDDVLGLYGRRHEAWRRGLYEAAYRPGLYLTDVEAGRVAPQFFHLHPTILAWWDLALGSGRGLVVLLLQSVCMAAALWAVARRLWPAGPWSLLPLALFAGSPLAIWVGRTALTESLTGLFLLAAALALLRERDAPRGELNTAALFLVGVAFVRGNGWLAAPTVLAVALFAPRNARGPGIVLGLGLLASVALHSYTGFPYVFDELGRQLGLPHPPTPALLCAVTSAGVLVWIGLHRVLAGRNTAWVPWTLAAASVLGLVAYAGLAATSPEKPFSRLDPWLPLVGWPMTGFATAGAVLAVRRSEADRSGAHVWLLALLAVPAATLLLYAPRNLPQLGLYYYGRYLIPELFPLACLLATVFVRWIHDGAARRWGDARPRVPIALAMGASLGLVTTTVAPLVLKPLSRMQEFEGAGRVIEHIARATPPESVIIAGGEGWHHGHTFNQVGGAVHLGYGRAVVPYRDREAAYATLHELLVAGPAAGRPARPVYLLLNEAARAYRPDGEAPPVSGIDDVLPAPFTLESADLLELKVHRLTPVTDRVPERLTRDDLRMGLLRVRVDPQRAAQVQTWTFADGEVHGPKGLRLKGGSWKNGRLCLTPEAPIRVSLPRANGPGSVVIVATPGTPDQVAHWSVKLNKKRRATTATRTATRRRSTLGPFPFNHRPKKVTIKGSRDPVAGAPCPHGGVDSLRLLPPDRPALQDADARGHAFAPANDLGHPYELTRWVSGRGLGRYRPGIKPKPKIKALSLLLTGKKPLTFAPAPMPGGAEAPLDLVVTLTKTKLSPGARVRVLVGGKQVAEIDPPDRHTRTWQSKPIEVDWPGPHATIRVELHGAGAKDGARVRDVALFTRSSPIPAVLVDRVSTP